VSFASVVANARFESVRLRRSRRIWLLLIPPVAGPIGSAIADLYLKIPSVGAAQILGLLVAGGLTALILLDLTALAVGEDLGRRAHLTSFVLPQRRSSILLGRLIVPVGGCLLGYGIGAVTILASASVLVTPQAGAAGPLFSPVHLAFALVALFLFLAGVAAVVAVMTRSSSEPIVAGVLAGVVVAGLSGYLTFEGTLRATFPLLLGVAGLAALGYAFYRFELLEG
jgi:hypothetical protein